MLYAAIEHLSIALKPGRPRADKSQLLQQPGAPAISGGAGLPIMSALLPQPVKRGLTTCLRQRWKLSRSVRV
jgi:hypothetical protein